MALEQAEDETERQAAEHRAEPLQHRHGDGADQVQTPGRGVLEPGRLKSDRLSFGGLG